jgi:hypothetical protein
LVFLLIILDAFKASQYITDLNLSFTDLGSNSLDALKEYLQTNHALQHLNMDSCALYDLTTISQAIVNNPMMCLRTLSIANNYLSDFRPIHKLLLPENYSVISILNCQGCNVLANAVQLLCDALKLNRRLTKLNLYQNSINDVGAEMLANMLRVNSTLTHLNLGRNQILDQGAYHLARVFGILHCDDIDKDISESSDFIVDDYTPLHNSYRQKRNTTTTTTTPTTGNALSKVTNPEQLIYLSKFHQNNSISCLNMDRNSLSKEAQLAFRKVMEKHQKVHVDLAYCDNPNAEENCCIS